MKNTDVNQEIENAIHEYCPLWCQWAKMLGERRALDPDFPVVKDAAIKGLKTAVSRIRKATGGKK